MVGNQDKDTDDQQETQLHHDTNDHQKTPGMFHNLEIDIFFGCNHQETVKADRENFFSWALTVVACLLPTNPTVLK